MNFSLSKNNMKQNDNEISEVLFKAMGYLLRVQEN
jgi:hypothetical protein